MAPALIASLIMGGIQLGKSVYDQIKGAAIRKNNPRPDYNIPFTSYDNLNLRRSGASRGFSEGTLAGLYGQQGQNQAGSINAILSMGGTPNDVNNVFGTTLNNNRQIGFENDRIQRENINALIGENDKFGEQLDKQWQVNKFAPYKDTGALASTYLQSANQGFGEAADTVSTGFAEQATAKLADEYAKMMNGLPTTTQSQPSTPNFNWSDPALYGNYQQPFVGDAPPGYENYNQLNF